MILYLKGMPIWDNLSSLVDFCIVYLYVNHENGDI